MTALIKKLFCIFPVALWKKPSFKNLIPTVPYFKQELERKFFAKFRSCLSMSIIKLMLVKVCSSLEFCIWVFSTRHSNVPHRRQVWTPLCWPQEMVRYIIQSRRDTKDFRETDLEAHVKGFDVICAVQTVLYVYKIAVLFLPYFPNYFSSPDCTFVYIAFYFSCRIQKPHFLSLHWDCL